LVRVLEWMRWSSWLFCFLLVVLEETGVVCGLPWLTAGLETVRLDVGEAVGYVSAVVWYGLVRRKERVTEGMEYLVLRVLYS
jgi:hypothetical protein